MSFSTGHALLIGVGSYIHHPTVNNLPNTVEDVHRLAALLTDPQYCGYPAEQVTVLHDATATRDGVLAALDQLVATTDADSTVLIYYAGHGHYDAPAGAADRTYYLTTHETDLTPAPPATTPATLDPERWIVPDTAISQAKLLTKLQRLPAERVLLIFNACYAGELHPTLSLGVPPAPSIQGSNPPEPLAAALLGTGSGRVIMSACRDSQVSQSGPGPTTIFAEYLLAALQGQDVPNRQGTISVFDLYQTVYAKVKARVLDRHYRHQEPVLTMVRGVGPFPVALYQGSTSMGSADTVAPFPEGDAVRLISIQTSQQALATLLSRMDQKLDRIDRRLERLAAPVSPLLPKPFQAPAKPHHFIGRNKEIKLLIELLTDKNEIDVYGIYGMGGIGKTALATFIAHELKQFYSDGVLWARLDVCDAYNTLSKFALSFGHDLSSVKDIDHRSSFVRSLLSDKKVLIVLDNVEKDDDINLLLPTIGSSSLIITSRHSALFSMRNAVSVHLDKLTSDDSIRLFMSTVKSSHNNSIFTNMICELLDGLPLAIEISAGNINCYGIPSYDYYKMLVRAKSKVSKLIYENQSLQASFDISWNYLKATEKRVFSILGLFKSDFIRFDALRYILKIDDFELRNKLGKLKVLSLIKKIDNDLFSLHPLIRDFAFSKIVKLKNLNSIKHDYSEFFLDFCRKNSRIYPKISDYLLDIQDGMAFFESIHNWEKYVKYIEGLSFFLLATADLSYIEEICRNALGVDNLDDYSDSKAYIYAAMGHLYRLKQDYSSSLEFLNNAIVISREIKNEQIEEAALHETGGILTAIGDVNMARIVLYKSLEINLRREDDLRVSKNFHEIGVLSLKLNKYDEGVEMLNRSIELKIQLGDKSGAGFSMLTLANHFKDQNKYQDALDILLETENLQESINDYRRLSKTYICLAEIYLLMNDLERARKYAELAHSKATIVSDMVLFNEIRNLLEKISDQT